MSVRRLRSIHSRRGPALVDPQFAAAGDLILTGPQGITYDAVAGLISATTGRGVSHHRLSVSELAARFEAAGVARDYAHILAGMDEAIAGGAEDRVTGEVERVTGRPPADFATLARANASAWR